MYIIHMHMHALDLAIARLDRLFMYDNIDWLD